MPYLVEVKHQIELAHILKVVVQDLNEQVNRFQAQELVVGYIDAEREKQAGVSSVDDLVRFELQRKT